MNWIEAQAAARPRAPAYRFGGRDVSWREDADQVARLAAALAARGAGDGTRVATLLNEATSARSALGAAMWLGAAVVPISPSLPAEQVRWRLRDSRADLLLFDWGRAPEDRSVEAVDIEALEPVGSAPAVPFDPDRLATILYTSGTTAEPKPVPLTWANHTASAAASAANLGNGPDDDWLCVLPMSHIAAQAIVFRSMLSGGCVTTFNRFEPGAVLDELRRGRVTLLSLVPTMLTRLVDKAGSVAEFVAQSGSLRAILLGGAPADPHVVRSCLALGLPLFQTYGMTETASQFATMPPERATEKVGSAGLPLHGAELRVRDAEGRDLVAEAGEIWVRGPMVTVGYLDRPNLNAERFVDGWFATRDWGRVDSDGFLWVDARREDLIVTGGENVAPEEVERVLNAHPDVLESAVFGLSDPDWGQRVVAAVVLAHGADPDLESHAREHLAPWQQPKEYRHVSELPKTATGKLQRSRCSEIFERSR